MLATTKMSSGTSRSLGYLPCPEELKPRGLSFANLPFAYSRSCSCYMHQCRLVSEPRPCQAATLVAEEIEFLGGRAILENIFARRTQVIGAPEGSYVQDHRDCRPRSQGLRRRLQYPSFFGKAAYQLSTCPARAPQTPVSFVEQSKDRHLHQSGCGDHVNRVSSCSYLVDGRRAEANHRTFPAMRADRAAELDSAHALYLTPGVLCTGFVVTTVCASQAAASAGLRGGHHHQHGAGWSGTPKPERRRNSKPSCTPNLLFDSLHFLTEALPKIDVAFVLAPWTPSDKRIARLINFVDQGLHGGLRLTRAGFGKATNP